MRIRVKSKGPRPLRRSQDPYQDFFSKECLTFVSGLFSGLLYLREPVTLKVRTANCAENNQLVGKSRRDQEPSKRTGLKLELARPFMAQTRKLNPEKGWALTRPHSYLEAEQDWPQLVWPLGYCSAQHCSAPLMTTDGHRSNREQMRKSQQDDTALPPPKQREDESTMFEAY